MPTPELFQQFACLGVVIGVQPWNPTCALYGISEGFAQQLFNWQPLLMIVGLLIGLPLGVYVVYSLIGLLSRFLGWDKYDPKEFNDD